MRTTPTLLLLAGLCAGTGLRAAPDDAFQCLIEPYRKIEIRSSVEALIDTVHVQRGSVVRKGQRLVDLLADGTGIMLLGAAGKHDGPTRVGVGDVCP
jgi:hypothetical protein